MHYLTAEAPPSAPTTNRARTVRGADRRVVVVAEGDDGDDGLTEEVGEVAVVVAVARGVMVT